MEDSQNIYLVVCFDEVGDAVMAVEKNSNFTPARGLVFVADPGMLLEQLGLVKDACYGAVGSVTVVDSNILMDISEPGLCFFGPIYLSQVFIRRSISSFEMVRPSSESLSPR
jgi:hypothetical protein